MKKTSDNYGHFERRQMPAFVFLDQASFKISEACWADGTVGDGVVTLRDGRKISFLDVKEWLRVSQKHFEAKAEAQGQMPVYRESPPPNPRRTNGQFRSRKDG